MKVIEDTIFCEISYCKDFYPVEETIIFIWPRAKQQQLHGLFSCEYQQSKNLEAEYLSGKAYKILTARTTLRLEIV